MIRRLVLSIGFQFASVNTLIPRVLLVEDTPDIALPLAAALRQGGMDVELSASAEAAMVRLAPQHGFDVVVLDLNLPGRDGLTVIEALRQRGDDVPLMVLTARSAVSDRVLGLNLGADDYVSKPFELAELEARLQALLRRPGRRHGQELRLGSLHLHLGTGTIQLAGRALALTPRETAVLRVLLQSAQRTVAKDRLHREVFGDEDAGLDAVEVLVFRLRRKLDALAAGVFIVTLRGMGYMLTDVPAGRDAGPAH
ncbi:MAG: response regulator transcription factor [Rhodoferax sp.]|nr:response regulator transcription factor [Rhodoferax sp.]